MANINKIRLSGQTYNIEDSNATKTISLTQAEYDALVSGGTLDPNAFYVITDAQGADLSQYWTSAQTQSAITQSTSGKVDTSTFNTYSGSVDTALNAKQDTLVSGTNIKTINNESILGSGNIEIQGGGKAVSGGTNISITTGETADTINCTLNAKNGAGNYSFGGQYAGSMYGAFSSAFGRGVKTQNEEEFSVGNYNISNFANGNFGNSGNTLFSVGNGTADNARHNAFEIRQNGDIYITSGASDIKLQDYLGGVEVSSAITSGDTNAVAGGAVYDKFDEVESVTAAALNALNDAIPTVTSAITSGSTDVITSGAVYDAIGDITTILQSI